MSVVSFGMADVIMTARGKIALKIEVVEKITTSEDSPALKCEMQLPCRRHEAIKCSIWESV